ncbi:MAG: hypothetical protein KAV00_18035, partial [Phycisphaerae bacterium]|nr:hypothetical protein [Phycisphaerae bacterium]
MIFHRKTATRPATQPAKVNKAAEANLAVRKRLRQVIPRKHYVGIAMGNVLNFLRNFSNCPIHVKWAVLEKAGITKNSKVNVRLTNVTLDKAICAVLDNVAGPGKLGFVVSDGVITISTQADLDRQTITRVYDIRDLILPMPADAEPVSLGWPKQKPQPKVKDKEPAPTKVELAKMVMDLIKTTIAPDSWRPKGKIGSIRLLAGQLIITQAPRHHKSIQDLLKQLRECRGMQIVVEARFINVSSATDKQLAKWLTKQTKAVFQKGKWGSVLSGDAVNAFIKEAQKS